MYETTERSGRPELEVYKLIGYENVRKKGKRIQTYGRRVWYLKEYDKGCPEEAEEYKKGLKPAEAVSPKEIFMPRNAQVIKEYLITKAVPEISSKEGREELWRESKKEEKPFLVLDKRGKYASFMYDMWNTPYDLSETALKS